MRLAPFALALAASALSTASAAAPLSSTGAVPFSDVPRLEVPGHRQLAAEHAGEQVEDRGPASAPDSTDGRVLGKVVYGYLPYWNAAGAIIRWDWISHLAWFDAAIGADGKLTSTGVQRLASSAYAAARDAAAARQKPYVITFTNFVPAEIGQLVGPLSATTRATIVEAVKTGRAQGANVDFENVPKSARDDFTRFMKALTDELHAAVPGSHVSSAIPMIDWSDSYDEAGLAAGSDGMMLMIYGCAWSNAPTARPLTPLKTSSLWDAGSRPCNLDETLKTWTELVPAALHAKIIAGLPWYGHLFPTVSDRIGAARTSSPGRSQSYAVCQPKVTAAGRRWDGESDTPWAARGVSGGGWEQLWCDDAESFRLKLQLVNSYQVGGIGLWALGNEGPGDDLWAPIRDELGVDPTPPNNPPLANAGPDRVGVVGIAVGVDGTGSSDPDNDALQWRWAQVEGPAPLAFAVDSPAPVFTAEVPGTYVLSLVVDDGRLSSAEDTVLVTIAARAPVDGGSQTPPDDSGSAGDAASGCGCSGVEAPVMALAALTAMRRRRR